MIEQRLQKINSIGEEMGGSRILNKEEKEFLKNLYVSRRQEMWAVAVGITKNTILAEDAVQLCFCFLIENIADLLSLQEEPQRALFIFLMLKHICRQLYPGGNGLEESGYLEDAQMATAAGRELNNYRQAFDFLHQMFGCDVPLSLDEKIHCLIEGKEKGK